VTTVIVLASVLVIAALAPFKGVDTRWPGASRHPDPPPRLGPRDSSHE
jgi:hypothetical protein